MTIFRCRDNSLIRHTCSYIVVSYCAIVGFDRNIHRHSFSLVIPIYIYAPFITAFQLVKNLFNSLIPDTKPWTTKWDTAFKPQIIQKRIIARKNIKKYFRMWKPVSFRENKISLNSDRFDRFMFNVIVLINLWYTIKK